MPYQKRHAPKCPNCGEAAEFYKSRIWCKACAKYFDHSAAPSVLVLDIEKSRVHIEVDTWEGKGLWKKNFYLNHENITEDWYILCWRAKWLLNKDSEMGACVTPKEAKNRDDKRVMGELHKILMQTDFVVTYNGNEFDIKKINWRLMKHHLLPVPHYGSIDVMKGIGTVAAPSSLSLDYIAKEFGYDGKKPTDKQLWEKCEAGDSKALKYMYEYNMGDVEETESVYLHVRPYLKAHPNFAEFLNYYQEVDPALDLGEDTHRCPRCLSDKGIASSKFSRYKQTPAGYFYKKANCPNCGCVVFEVHKPNSKRMESQKVFIK